MAVLYSNFLQGTLSSGITNSATSISSTAFANLPVVASPDILYLVLDPGQSAGVPEVVTVTAHTASATSVTVTRGSQGSTARSHLSGVTWTHSWTKADAETVNPAGVISMFGGSSAPTGWLLCDGTAVSRTTYAALFSAIGTTYGVGNGSTTFNLPNLTGRVPVGRDAGQAEFDVLGETGGAKTHTLSATESGVPAHSHTNTLSNNTVGSSAHTHDHTSPLSSAFNIPIMLDVADADMDATGSYAVGTAATIPYYTSPSTTTGINITRYIVTSTGPSATTTVAISNVNNTAAAAASAHNNLQPYIVLNYIIKT